MKVNWVKIGKHLKARLNSERGCEILDKYQGGTWTAGGCFFLSITLFKMIPGKIVAMYGKPFKSEGRFCAQHCLFEVENGYLDGDGFSNKHSIIKRWTKWLSDIKLDYHDKSKDHFYEDFYDENCIAELTEFLKPVFKKILIS